MLEFIGAYKEIGKFDKEYVKIIAINVDHANEKLEDYLHEKDIKWTEIDIIQIEIVIH